MSEATSIDKLSIEIVSNSNSAAQGIKDLASALGELKGNGSVGVAVKNLNNLSDALRKLTPVTSNANKLSALAKSVTELSKAGSFGRVINQLNKLPTALGGLSSLNIDNNLGAKLERLAQATTPLANIKTGGLGTMVNALAKISKVTDSLDDGTIARFADRVSKLNEKLGPLSAKMTTIQAGLRGVNSSARSAAGGVKELGTKVDATSLNFASMVTVIEGAINILRPIVNLLSGAITQAMEWDGISYQFGKAFGEQADEYAQKITEITDALKINKQEFMGSSSMMASMLKGFGVGSEDAREMGIGYTELAYDIWAAYNNVYKTLDGADGAMAAIRSAVSGEVEPIRRAGFTIVDSQLKITAANYGIAYSSEKATEAQKSYLRYLTLIDQAANKGVIGTYAKEMNTAEGLTRTLTQQMKSLAQAFGSLFLPILVEVLPWLQAFVELLTEVVVIVAGFFGVDIQPATWGSGIDGALEGVSDSADAATDSLDSAAGAAGSAKKAVEDLKKATLGIDELNVISPPTESGGGGGGGGGGAGDLDAFEALDISSIWDESILAEAKSKVAELKDTIKGFIDEFRTEIEIIAGLLAALGVAKLLQHLGEAIGLGETFIKHMDTIAKLAVTGIVIVLQYTLVSEFMENYIDGEGFKEYLKALFVSAIATYVLYSMWGPAGLVIGLGITAAASLKAVIDNGGVDSTESAVVALTGLASAVGAFAAAWKLLEPVIEGMKEYVAAAKLMSPEVGTLAAWFPKLTSALAPVGSAFSGAASAVGTFIAGLGAGTLAAIAAAIIAVADAAYFVYENWDAVVQAVKNFFNENIVPKLEGIKESWEKIKEVLSPLTPLFEAIGEKLQPLIQWFKDAAKSIGEFFAGFDWIEGIKTAFEKFGGVIFTALTTNIAGAFNAAANVIEGFVQVISGIVQIVGGVIEAVVKLFSGDLNGAWEACKKIGDGIADVFVGLYDMTIGAVVEFVEGIIDWFREMWDILVGHSIVPDTIDAIIDWFKSLPTKLGDTVKNFVSGIVDAFKNLGTDITKKFSSAWSAVKEWWANKKTLSVPEVGVSLVKKGWTTVKDWIGSIPGVSQAVKLAKSGWSTVKKWVGSIPALNQAIKLAKSGWSSVKSWVGTMPSLSAKIKLAKDGWSTVKKWLGDLSYKLSFKLPKIGINWGTKKFMGFEISYPKSFYTYAKGGFPDFGELFVAREAGPEMVGKIGNRTTVANNDQIVEGISEGVYTAVLAAMRASESNGSQAVNVYLDGKLVTQSVEKRQHERGASIMGRQVYSY